LNKVLDVQDSSHQSLIANLKSTEKETKIQAAAVIRDTKKLKAAVSDIANFTTPPNEERVQALNKEISACDSLAGLVRSLQDRIKEEHNMQLQVIETEFQLKKKSVEKGVDPQVIEGMRSQISEMKFRHSNMQGEVLDEMKGAIKKCEKADQTNLNAAVLEVLKKLAGEFQATVAKSSEQKDEDVEEVPPHFLCPILQEIMVDPVLTLDGQTYERSAIEEWLKNHDTSPATNLPLPQKMVFPNIALKNMIEDWRKKNNQ
jgi:hypothetical protein